MAYAGLIIWMSISSFLCMIKGSVLDLNKNRKLYLGFFAFGCFCIMALRSVDVGVDTYHYSVIYEHIAQRSISSILSGFYFDSIEVGYALFMKICSYFSDSYYFFQVIYSLIYSFGLYSFLSNHIKNSYWGSIVCLGLGMLLITFNIQRQMLAVIIAINSWKFYCKRKYAISLFLILLAMTMHITAFLVIGLFFLDKVSRNKLVIRIMPFLLIGAILFYQPIIGYVSSYLPMYNNYYSNQKEILEAGMVKIMWAIVTAISLYQIYFSRSKNRYYSVYAMASLIFVAANVIGLGFNYIERLGMYFVPFVILMLEDFGENFEGTWIRRLYWITSGTCFLAFFLITCMSSFQYHYSIWL